MAEPVVETIFEKLNRMEGLIDSEQVVAIFGWTAASLRVYVAKKYIPSFRLGRLVKFDPGQLAQWLKKRQA